MLPCRRKTGQSRHGRSSGTSSSSSSSGGGSATPAACARARAVCGRRRTQRVPPRLGEQPIGAWQAPAWKTMGAGHASEVRVHWGARAGAGAGAPARADTARAAAACGAARRARARLQQARQELHRVACGRKHQRLARPAAAPGRRQRRHQRHQPLPAGHLRGAARASAPWRACAAGRGASCGAVLPHGVAHV